MKSYYTVLKEQYEARNTWEIMEASRDIDEKVKKEFQKRCPSKLRLSPTKRKQAALCVIEADLRGMEASMRFALDYDCFEKFAARSEDDTEAVNEIKECNKLKIEVLEDVKARFERAKITIRKLRGF